MTKGNTYGYEKGEPCVLLKINKVYGWLPPINDSVTVEKWNDLSALGKTNDAITAWGPWVNCSGEVRAPALAFALDLAPGVPGLTRIQFVYITAHLVHLQCTSSVHTGVLRV